MRLYGKLEKTLVAFHASTGAAKVDQTKKWLSFLLNVYQSQMAKDEEGAQSGGFRVAFRHVSHMSTNPHFHHYLLYFNFVPELSLDCGLRDTHSRHSR